MNYTLKALLTPGCWVQIDQYSETWDRKLLELMKAHRFERVGDYHHKIAGCLIWTANHPYGSFRLRPSNVRPSRATILKAMDKLVEDVVARNSEKANQ